MYTVTNSKIDRSCYGFFNSVATKIIMSTDIHRNSVVYSGRDFVERATPQTMRTDRRSRFCVTAPRLYRTRELNTGTRPRSFCAGSSISKQLSLSLCSHCLKIPKRFRSDRYQTFIRTRKIKKSTRLRTLDQTSFETTVSREVTNSENRDIFPNSPSVEQPYSSRIFRMHSRLYGTGGKWRMMLIRGKRSYDLTNLSKPVSPLNGFIRGDARVRMPCTRAERRKCR